jgi:NAD(P)-dependent dehydrogenase (short-subunit alcohol dehydrogenase family)
MPQTILITGTSSGMGRDMVEYFAKKGWNVAATMRNPAKDGIGFESMGSVKTYALDVTDQNSIQAAIDETIIDFDGLDVVVNNAGVGQLGPMEGASDSQIDQQIAVNFRGPISVMRAALPHFRAQKSGMFVNITSIGGRMTMPHNSVYHGMKWGLEGFTEALSYELRPFGIKLKLIAPGGVKTDFAGRSLTRTNAGIDKEYERQLEAFVTTAMKRSDNWSEPRVVSEVVYEAVSDGSDKLRYLAGDDAKMMSETRGMMSDEDWINMMNQNFGF